MTASKYESVAVSDEAEEASGDGHDSYWPCFPTRSGVCTVVGFHRRVTPHVPWYFAVYGGQMHMQVASRKLWSLVSSPHYERLSLTCTVCKTISVGLLFSVAIS